MATILISACLIGEAVRYNASSLRPDATWLDGLAVRHRLVPFCPEVAAGLPTPRACAEIRGGDGYDVLRGEAEVIDREGRMLSAAFRLAAAKTLEVCRTQAVEAAIMAENSPSCGRNSIYDGSFCGRRKAGLGVSAALLVDNGLPVFSQQQLSSLTAFLDTKSRR